MNEILTTSLFWWFVGLNFINVLVNTARSLITVKGGKWLAAIANSVCYGYYTVIIVITATYEMPLIVKCVAVAIVNFIGVFTIKFCEEKLQKDKLWVYNVTAKEHSETIDNLILLLKGASIKLVYNTVIEDKLYTLQIFSNNQKESKMITSILDNYSVKYCAIETKEKNTN